MIHNSADIDGMSDVSMTGKAIEVRYRVNGINIAESNLHLSEVFGSLADLMRRKLIKDFSMTRTNMEQVFINFAKFQIRAAIDGQ